MVLNQIKKSFTIAEKRKWDKIFYAYDIHETILIPDYSNLEPLQFYPFAKEALQLMTKHPMLINILYTCSHPEEIDRYLIFFKTHDINFKYVNDNPDVTTTELGCFDKKFYFNALFEDKSGFDALTEWEDIYHYFNTDSLFSQLYSKFWGFRLLYKFIKKIN